MSSSSGMTHVPKLPSKPHSDVKIYIKIVCNRFIFFSLLMHDLFAEQPRTKTTETILLFLSIKCVHIVLDSVSVLVSSVYEQLHPS